MYSTIHTAKLISVLVLVSIVSHAQRFLPVETVVLPDSLLEVRTESADLDNDGLADVVVFARSSNSNNFVLFIKGDTLSPREVSTKLVKTISYTSYVIHDYDNNNQLDILLSPSTGAQNSILLKNQGDFSFQTFSTNLPQFSLAKFGDLDRDGSIDCVIANNSGSEYRIQTYSRTALLEWQLVDDTLMFEATALELFDFDRDGNNDIFLSGKLKPDSIVSVMMVSQDSAFVISRKHESLGKSILSDVDHNGFWEVMLFGKNRTGQNVVQPFDTSKPLQPAPFTNTTASLFSADLTSDGLVDLNTFEVDAAQDSSNYVAIAGQGSELINSRSLVGQNWIDFDQDGDLDLMQLLHSKHFELKFVENKTGQENKAPTKSSLALAVPVYDRTLIFWTESPDDHTSGAAITYDLLLQGPEIYYPGNFDLSNGKRLLSAPGNNGSATFKLINSKSSDLKWAIQAVDNSLFGGAGSICMGSGLACVQTQVEKISACTGENIELSSAASAHWFSFADGFIGIGNSTTIRPHEMDTVFSFIPSPSGCSLLKLYEISIDDAVQKTEQEVIYTCLGSQLSLSVGLGWESYTWKNSSGVVLGSTNGINHAVTGPDQIFVEYANKKGCVIEEQFDIRISLPSAILSSSEYHLMKGQSVQLSASGGEAYHWTPASGLNNADVSNPIASPSQDTQYSVLVTDSIGCTATASLTVFVESTGFIPSLFTPNSDGQNDVLKVYGLSMVNDFRLRIYNREGNVVYKTESVNEALQSGWDGRSNGVDQPNGVYFWKVDGMSGTGRRLLLNGKNEGSIVLLR